MYSTPPPNCISVNDGSDLTCIQWIMLLTVVASYWSRRGPSSMVWVRSSLELRLEGRARTYPTAKVCWLLPFLSSFQREFSSCRPKKLEHRETKLACRARHTATSVKNPSREQLFRLRTLEKVKPWIAQLVQLSLSSGQPNPKSVALYHEFASERLPVGLRQQPSRHQQLGHTSNRQRFLPSSSSPSPNCHVGRWLLWRTATEFLQLIWLVLGRQSVRIPAAIFPRPAALSSAELLLFIGT